MVSITNVPRLANLAVGLGSMTGPVTMSAVPGPTPRITGLSDRTILLNNAHVLV